MKNEIWNIELLYARVKSAYDMGDDEIQMRQKILVVAGDFWPPRGDKSTEREGDKVMKFIWEIWV